MFATSSSRNSGERSTQSNSDANDLFVNNIPIELDKNGLANIFSRAGPIELVKIMPPKNSSNDYTYGFVRFKHKTAAATAIEMFHNYKIGPRCLDVKFSSKSSSTSYSSYSQQAQPQQGLTKISSDDGWESISRSTKSVNLINDDQDRYTDSVLKRSGQNGSTRHLPTSNVRPERGNYDLSRPYAQEFVKRNKITITQNNDAPTERMKANENVKVPSSNVNKNPMRLNQEECKASTSEKLEIGKTYQVNLTHVESPSNFHIQLLSSVSKTGNLMNNLNNHYRNEFADEDENKQYYFETNELCVCYYDSYWYRAQVVRKVAEKRTYLLKIIDFGDVQELPYEYVRKLNKEFSSTERASIRCKLAGISPLKGEKNWDPQATHTLLSLAENPSEIVLCAEIISCQEVRNKNDKLETIYSVDLLFEGAESIITYFIENEFAIKVNEDTHPQPAKTQAQTADSSQQQQQGQRQTTSSTKTSTRRYSIFEQQKIDLNLKPNQVCQQVSVTHVENINEFYAQSVENLREIVKLQSKLTNLFKKYERAYLDTYKQVSLHSGDYVFARYQDKKQIDRAIVVKTPDASSSHMYQLHFVDQAYKDETTSQYIYSASLMHELIVNMGQPSDLDDLNAIIELPFQIICCQLKDKKESVRNTEILKALINECLNFQLEIVNVTKQTLGEDGDGRKVFINKYVIRLYSDDDLLDEKFECSVKQVGEKSSTQTIKTEQVQPPVQPVVQPVASKPVTQPQLNNENLLELSQVYKCKFAFLGDETEMFINLASDVDKLTELEALLNDKIEIDKIQKNARGKLAFKIGDLVLAKYYFDNEFNWYRAIVNKVCSEREYEVYYIDYGNSDKVAINDLIELPSKYDLHHFKQFAYHVKFNQVNFNANLHLSKLEDYLQSEFLNIKIVSVESEQQSQEHKRDKHLYSVEFWSEDMKVCLNTLIDSSYVPKPKETAVKKPPQEQLQPAQKPVVSKPRLIEQTSLKFVGKEMTVNTSSTYIEKLTKPFYLCLEQDISSRKSLQESMNQFYAAKHSSTSANLKLNDYCAVFSEDNWFRAQVKKTDNSELLLFYIDFGYEEILDSKTDRIKSLDEQFIDFPRYSFGVVLLNPKDYHTPLELNQDEDENILSDAFERFFAMNTDELVIKIKSKLDLNNNDTSPTQILNNETYYAVQMHNKLDECLNEILFKEKEAHLKKKLAKKQRPNLIRLTSKDLPEQTTGKQINENDEYMLFTRRMELFYIFDENKVKSVQNKIQEICHGILEDQKEFDEEQMRNYDAEHLPNKDDLVFGKYVDDQAWYRCVVTNCNHALGKYELFFVDFGNTEVVARDEILYTWNEEQTSVFKNYEPHAYKCKLFGIVSKPSNDAQKEDLAFKTYTSDNIFNVKLIDYNQKEKIFEVSLKCITNGQTAHEYLLEHNLIEMNKFTDIVRSINSIEQQDFYIQLLKSLKITRKHFK